jgi:hypothetical protein
MSLRHIEELIEIHRDSWLENEIKAVERKQEKNNEYSAGLASGMAIADKHFVRCLRDIRALLLPNVSS